MTFAKCLAILDRRIAVSKEVLRLSKKTADDATVNQNLGAIKALKAARSELTKTDSNGSQAAD